MLPTYPECLLYPREGSSAVLLQDSQFNYSFLSLALFPCFPCAPHQSFSAFDVPQSRQINAGSPILPS